MAEGRTGSARIANVTLEVALVRAVIDGALEAFHGAKRRFLATAARGRPAAAPATGTIVEVVHEGHLYRAHVLWIDAGRFRVTMDGRTAEVGFEPAETPSSTLRYGGVAYRTSSALDGRVRAVEVDGARHVFRDADEEVVTSPAPAVVVALHTRPGAAVEPGEPLLVLEAMKMEMTVAAPAAGVVRSIVEPNTQVGDGAPLVRLALPSEDVVTDEPRIELPTSIDADTAERPCAAVLDRLMAIGLGFDADRNEARAMANAFLDTCGRRPLSPQDARCATVFLELFTGLCALSQRRVETDEDTESDRWRGAEDELLTYLRTLDADRPSLSDRFREQLRHVVGFHGVSSVQRSSELEDAMFRVYRSTLRLDDQAAAAASILQLRLADARPREREPDLGFRGLLDRLIAATERRLPAVHELARELRYRAFDQPIVESQRAAAYAEVLERIGAVDRTTDETERAEHVRALAACPYPVRSIFASMYEHVGPRARAAMLEAIARRYYRIRQLNEVRVGEVAGVATLTATYPHEGRRIRLVAAFAERGGLERAARVAARISAAVPPDEDAVVDLYAATDPPAGDDPDADALAARDLIERTRFRRLIRRIVVSLDDSRDAPAARLRHFTFRQTDGGGYAEERLYRGLHPMMGKRLHLWRLENFRTERLPSAEDVYLFQGVARENPKDERLFAIAEVRDLTPVRAPDGTVVALPEVERMLTEALSAIRTEQSRRPAGKRLQWNRVLLYVRPPVELPVEELARVAAKLVPLAEGLGLQKVVAVGRIRNAATGELDDTVLHVTNAPGRGLAMRFDRPADAPIRPLSEYQQKVVLMRQRGLVYPYELINLLTPRRDDMRTDFPAGDFAEHDLDDEGELIPVDRPYGENRANIVVGVIRSFTEAYPEGLTRVALFGDPSRALGSLAEPECRRIIAGLDLAERMRVPLEWFALSAGAKIAMDSGTENMDWIARVLRRLIEFTQAGHEVNIVVSGINVGAQPYWNAEATMLMHTKGILVMTPESAMVLTGKQALDYSGGVSAEDNFGIGGYDRVMGPNGQAQYWARDVGEACSILLRHYDHTYVAPGERFPRRVPTTDPVDRDVRDSPHRDDGSGFRTVGDVFSDQTNPGRKKPFDIRSVMRSVVDADRRTLERWGGMRDAEIAVVWDAHLAGRPVEIIGIESRPLPRLDPIPADGPDHWTAGTLFPLSSKKIARAVNAASGNRPVVVLANLSGFDGSPESLRKLQLEYGAEIGRSVTNFDGPIVFCVVSRYHGGAFVVFSATLNDSMEVAAVEGSYASVIGGAPAAAVVFTRDVDARTKNEPRVVEATAVLEAEVDPDERQRLQAAVARVTALVRAEKVGEVATEFDRVHTIYRAREVGSVHRIIPARELRPYLIDAVERGIARELRRLGLER